MLSLRAATFLELRLFEARVFGHRAPLLPTSYYDDVRKVCPPNELRMHRDVVRVLGQVGWKPVAHEWPARHGCKQGVGDLVFQRGNTFFVIECKRRHKQKVYDQARFYAAAWISMLVKEMVGSRKYKGDQRTFAFCVLYGVWTCQTQEILGCRKIYL